MLRSSLIHFAFFIVLGCGVTSDNRPVEQVYREKVSELGLVPVYPPREDVRVGDIFFFSHDGDPATASLVLVDTLHTSDLVTRFLEGIPAYTSTKIEKGKIDVQNQEDISQGNGIDTRANVQVNTLPVAAFPDITGVSSRSFGLGRSAAGGAFGLSGSAAVYETLSFQSVRTYAANPRDIWARGADRARQIDLGCAEFWRKNGWPQVVTVELGRRSVQVDRCTNSIADLRQGMNLLIATNRDATRLDPCGSGRVCGYFVVTRLYLTRQINYTYSGGSGASFGVQPSGLVDLSENSGNSSESNLPTTNIILLSDGESGNDEDAQSDAVAALVEAFQDQNDGQLSDGISATSIDARGISYSEIFPRPLVIAWDGISFTYQDYEIRNARP